MPKKIALAFIVLIILIVNALRLSWLDDVPSGYNVDELAGAVSLTCLATQGVDAHLQPHPLFLDQRWATPKPPVYAYPGALWTKLFGHQVDQLRAFSAFAAIVSIIGLYFLGTLLFNKTYGLFAALVASISPWSWCISRIAYEPIFCLPFLVWGMFFFLRSRQSIDKICAAFLFACAMYAYPPCRMQVPLFLILLLIYDFKRNPSNKGSWVSFFATFIICCLPLAQQTLAGNLQQRFNEISIFNPQYLQSIGKTNNLFDIAGIVLNNFASHFNWLYLFKTGDPIGGHTSQQFGILSWLDLLGLLAVMVFVLWKSKETHAHLGWLLFLTGNVLIGILPASITFIDLPSALRTIGSSPFFHLLTAYGLWRLANHWNFFYLAISVAGLVFSCVYLKNYFTVYPKESVGWFDVWSKQKALNAKTQEDWIELMVRNQNNDYHFRYFLMNHLGESCSSSRAKWSRLRELLGLSKVY